MSRVPPPPPREIQSPRESTVSSDHDGFVMVFARELGEYKLRIKECDDGDEIICEPPLKLPGFKEPHNKSLVHCLKEPDLLVSRYTTYELMYGKANPDRYIFCLVRIKEEEAMEWADEKEIELEADAKVAVREGRKLNFRLALATYLPETDNSPMLLRNGQQYEKLPLNIWDEIHLPYSKYVPHQDIYMRHGPELELLENRMQLKILFQVLTEDRRLGGGGFHVDSAILDWNNPLVSFFALHCPQEIRPALSDEDIWGWRLMCSMWYDKVHGIRDYYGEVVGFYFAFLSHYTRTLFPFAAIGLLYFLIQLGLGEIAVDGLAALTMVIIGITWSTVMIEYWYRREWSLRFRWGMMRAAASETPRPEFEGSVVLSPTTGELFETYSNTFVHYLKLTGSISFIVFCIMAVVSIVAGIWIAKTIYPDNFWWSVFIGFINGIQIQILNYFYIQMALFLNNWEQHRLQQEYDNHLVVKKITFYCVNSFNSLFYIAFVQPLYCSPTIQLNIYCHNQTILRALRIQLVTLFLTAIIINNFFEFAYPPLYVWAMNYLYTREEDKRELQTQSRSLLPDEVEAGGQTFSGSEAEKYEADESFRSGGLSSSHVVTDSEDDDVKVDIIQEPPKGVFPPVSATITRTPTAVFDEIIADIEEQVELAPMPDMLDNMAEIVVQYGYIMLFIIIFPLMPLLGIINNLVEMRVDLYNVINTQRPVPRSAGGIGVWKQVMSVFGIISVFSNLGVICYRSSRVSDLVGPRWVNIFYLVNCMIIIGIQVTIRSFIVDIPKRIKEGIERQEYCEKHLIAGAVKNEMSKLTVRVRALSEFHPPGGAGARSANAAIAISGPADLSNMSRVISGGP